MNAELNKDEERWLLLRARMLEENIKTAFGYLRGRGVEPILIKGWAASRMYPDRHRRIFADIDLAVAPELYEKTRSLLGEGPCRNLNVDLHRGMRHLDTVPWPDLFENSVLADLDGMPIRLLRPEDHLRVLCVHWLNDGGAHREKLLDVYYAVRNRPADFDWQRALGTVGPNRREWIVKTIGLARRYLDLDVSDLPFAAETENLPAWLVRSLEAEWASGVRLKPMETLLRSRKNEIWPQLKKRFPPNAIQATIEAEGRFDAKSRAFYQLTSIGRRFAPSVRRIFKALKITVRPDETEKKR
jgi:hypothetical protein